MSDILKKDLKLLLFGGKGGTGKTTAAASTALYAAKQGKKVLVFSTDPVLSLSDSFKCKIGNKVTNITKNVDALEMDTDTILEEFRENYNATIQQIISEGTYLDEEDTLRFSELPFPGMDEFMALVKIIDFLDKDEYDLYILDTAPSGHTIRLLALPDLIIKWTDVLIKMHAKKGVIMKSFFGKAVKDRADRFLTKLQNDIKRVRATLMDKEKTQFVVITIAEAMGVYETTRFIKILESYKIPIGHIIFNKIIPNNKCDFCNSVRKEQQRYIKKIKKEFSYDIIEAPLFPYEIRGLENLYFFSKALYGEDYQVEFKKFSLFSFSKNTLHKPSKMHSVFEKDLKLLLFGGKGGTGKTSMATSTALQAAKQGKKVLVFSTDPAHSLSDSFDKDIGDKITYITKNVYAQEIDAVKLFKNLKKEYKEEVKNFFKRLLTPKRGISLPLDEEIMADLFDLSPPGVDELMALKKILDFIDSKEYDLFILDTAPTGHTLRLLALPDEAIEWMQFIIDIKTKYPTTGEVGDSLGTTLKTIKRGRKILTNPAQTEFIPVTAPNALSIYQTERLINNLGKLKIPVEYMVVNKIIPTNKCDFCKSRRKQQENYIREINKKFSKYKITEMPQFEYEINGLKKLTEFSETLFR
ncbi:MAG: ArsA family ATPase [Nanoarchaeota archaeon]|nr:ArsA family ATPase [Nanoarchaeota archaeon]